MNYVPKSFNEVLLNNRDKLSILEFFVNLLEFNKDPILNKEIEKYAQARSRTSLNHIQNICVLLGSTGCGKTAILKYFSDKLNMRAMYYESLSSKEIDTERLLNKEIDVQEYYHPFIEFLENSQFHYMYTKKPKEERKRKQVNKNDMYYNNMIHQKTNNELHLNKCSIKRKQEDALLEQISTETKIGKYSKQGKEYGKKGEGEGRETEYNISNNAVKDISEIEYMLKEKRKQRYYERHYVKTRVTIIDELPITYLERSENFRTHLLHTIQRIHDYVNCCKEIRKKNCDKKMYETKKQENLIHPLVICISSYEEISIVNSILRVNINEAPSVRFIKLRKIEPWHLENVLSNKYYAKMMSLNENTKDIIKYYIEQSKGDIRTCFISLDFLNRSNSIETVTLQDIKNYAICSKIDILDFVKKVLYKDIAMKDKKVDASYSKKMVEFNLNFSESSETYLNQYIKENIIKQEHIMNQRNLNHSINTIGSDKKIEKGASRNHMNNNFYVLNKIKKSIDTSNSTLFEELDMKVNLMGHTEKLNLATYLKENYLFFYNKFDDVAHLLCNLSLINYKLGGLYNIRRNNRQSSDSQYLDHTISLINNNLKLIYRYYILCNTSPRIPIGNPGEPPDVEQNYSFELMQERKFKHSIYNQQQRSTYFTFKENAVDKYFFDYNKVLNQLYERYCNIIIKKIQIKKTEGIERSKDSEENKKEKEYEIPWNPIYNLLFHRNHHAFLINFPILIHLAIQEWNSKSFKKNNKRTIDTVHYYNNNSNNNNNGYSIEKNHNKNHLQELYSNTEKNTFNQRIPKILQSYKDSINYVNQIITPRFIAIFFPRYLVYLNNETKQKINANIFGNSYVSLSKYLEIKRILNMSSFDFYNYFFQY